MCYIIDRTPKDHHLATWLTFIILRVASTSLQLFCHLLSIILAILSLISPVSQTGNFIHRRFPIVKYRIACLRALRLWIARPWSFDTVSFDSSKHGRTSDWLDLPWNSYTVVKIVSDQPQWDTAAANWNPQPIFTTGCLLCHSFFCLGGIVEPNREPPDVQCLTRATFGQSQFYRTKVPLGYRFNFGSSPFMDIRLLWEPQQ